MNGKVIEQIEGDDYIFADDTRQIKIEYEGEIPFDTPKIVLPS